MIYTGLKDTAFFAALDQSKVPIGNPAIIIWKDVKYNNGGHYDSRTGAYTAPLAGYYQFTVSSMNAGNVVGETWAYFYLVIDGEDFCFQGTYDPDHTWQQKNYSQA